MEPALEATCNTFTLGPIKFWALGDRVIIREDEFRSGYECSTCSGACKIQCPNCNGTKQSAVVPGAKCSGCDGEGSIQCPACGGKGGTIIIPDNAQRRPTTGTVVSAGEACKVLKPGQSVLYSNFAGYVIGPLFITDEQVTLRILHESEILGAVEGHLELRTVRGRTDIPTYNP